MTIVPNQPIIALDFEKVHAFRVTLEEPYKGAGLRWRQGTTSAKKNLNFNAHDPNSGEPYHPGVPIMYPEDAPAIAGTETASFIMPKDAAMTAFGYFYAPLTEKRGEPAGFTISAERGRVAQFWAWYKMPKGDGTMHPPMNRVGPPDVPAVALRPLNANMNPILVDGEEVVIRPREFFDFENPAQYDTQFAEKPPVRVEVSDQLAGFSAAEREELHGLLAERVKRKAAKNG